MKTKWLALAVLASLQQQTQGKIDLGNGDNIKHNPRNNRKTKGKKK